MIAKEIHDSLIYTKGVNLFGAGFVMPSDIDIDFNYVDYAYLESLNQDSDFSNLGQILEKFEIDDIFLAHDEWIYRFRDTNFISGSMICKHPASTIDIASFKSKTYAQLNHLGITPTVYKSIEEVDSFPFVIKPDRGQGSKGFIRIDSAIQFQNIVSDGLNSEEMVISEFLPGDEYTVDCFTDINGDLLFSSCRIRSVIGNGLSSTTEISSKPALLDIAIQLNSEFKFTGAWFFQTKNDKDNLPKLLEIGCRVAGASGIQRALGVNLSELWLYMFSGQAITVTKNNLTPRRIIGSPSQLFLGQDFEQIFVDFDDCLIIKKNLNVELLNFLKAEKLKNVKIFLISRHKGNLKLEVEKLGISSLFDQIHHILDDSRKSDHFSHSKNILFIDDSYSERADLKSFPHVRTVDPSIFVDHVSSNL
jgi:hypothetical protein